MLMKLVISAIFLHALACAEEAPKDPKAFSLFSVVTFKNEDCQSTSTTTMNGPRNGTCYTSTECTDKGGTKAGSCAMGFGSCCIFTKDECSSTIDQNNTYVRNDGFPTALTGASISSCSFTIRKCDNEICRVRLDFESFTTLGPTGSTDGAAAGAGDCIDSFAITGLSTGNSVVPTICGENMGQHMYFELGEASGDTAMMAFTFGATAGSRSFEIRVTQYPCNSALTPPEGCLQWHTGTDGRFKTFNFDGDTVHLHNQDYNICIRREEGMRCVQYQACSDDNSMTLWLFDAKDATKGLADSTDCTLDFVTIEGSHDATCSGILHNKFCGGSLNFETQPVNTIVCDCTAPFAVGIHTNAYVDGTDDDAATVKSRGVCLEYNQIA